MGLGRIGTNAPSKNWMNARSGWCGSTMSCGHLAQSSFANFSSRSARAQKFVAKAEALARSSALLDEDLDPFAAEARRQFGPGADVWVLVSDVNGQQLFNTFAQRGEPLPRRHPLGLEAHQRALATGSIVISDLFQGGVSKD